MAYSDGDMDMVGLDEVRNAYVLAACEHVLEAVAWLVEKVAEGHVKAKAWHESG